MCADCVTACIHTACGTAATFNVGASITTHIAAVGEEGSGCALCADCVITGIITALATVAAFEVSAIVTSQLGAVGEVKSVTAAAASGCSHGVRCTTTAVGE